MGVPVFNSGDDQTLFEDSTEVHSLQCCSGELIDFYLIHVHQNRHCFRSKPLGRRYPLPTFVDPDHLFPWGMGETVAWGHWKNSGQSSDKLLRPSLTLFDQMSTDLFLVVRRKLFDAFS